MRTWLNKVPRAVDRFGLVGVITAKITCLVGMQLSLILGVIGASGVALPFLDPVNRVLGPVSVPLFVVSLGFLALGAVRRGPIALALVAGGALLLYAAVFAYGMNPPLYGLAMAMLLAPFVAGPLWSRLVSQAGLSKPRDVSGATGG